MFLFCDGFDSVAATSDLSKKWNGATLGSDFSWNATANQAGGPAVVAAGTTGGTYIQAPVAPAQTYTCVGFRVKASAIPGAVGRIFDMGNGGTININSSTGYVLMQNAGATVVTASRNICDGNWHWIEAYFYAFGPSATLYVDGANWGTSTAGSFSGPTSTYVRLQSVAGITLTFDDVIVWDTLGSTFNTFPIGQRQITTVRPVSDGTCTFATLSSGTSHFSLVNEVNPDTTTWVQDGTSGHQDLYNYAALGYTPTVITAVVVNSWLENPNPGTINYEAVCLSGSTTALGTSTAAQASFHTMQDVFVHDPSTSAAWTAAGLNAAQFGVRVP